MPIWYGGDYNPEQWPEGVWDEDVRLMRRAGVTLATVGVFSWSRIETAEGEFDFGWLDRVLDRLHAGGIRVDLATATASPPPWLTGNHPEVLPERADGTRLWPGSRQQYCPSSPVYRRLATRLVTTLAERYADHPALAFWHIGNEYGCHVSRCYCDRSADAFRDWLRVKYGSIDALNEAWGAAFWSQRYGEFTEIHPPRAMPTFGNPAQLLDFDRFSSNELLECFRMEKEIVRRFSPDVPVTTNFMGPFKPVDYWRWAGEVDVVADDSYPDPVDPRAPAQAAFARDLMRSLGGGAPWILMEQAPSAVNWRASNAPKAPGQMRAWSYQALARGADGILFFQWRQSVAGAEKFHSGMLPHAGTDTRAWREIEALGRELGDLDRVIGSRVPAKTAIVFDWDSWWSLGQPATPGDIDYLAVVRSWYEELWRRTVPVDVVRADGDLSGYDLVLAPCLFVAPREVRDNLDAYVRGGGTLLVTYQSAVTDENARILDGGYLGSLRDLLGIRIEEFHPPAAPDPSPAPPVGVDGEIIGAAPAAGWAEHLDAPDAEVLGRFTDGALAGSPALTRRATGDGAAWYVATQPTAAGLSALIDRLIDEAGVEPILAEPIPDVEAIRRGDTVFLINHSATPTPIPGTDERLEPQGVLLLASEPDREEPVDARSRAGSAGPQSSRSRTTPPN